ncbi:hypothetical protein LOK49_LG04G01277 [Camellia lanceoleosa]|uniref:Uncharacterized protein n=1 Tax=Camellia lanceoleosa TaxID=1840588 RepID=A0ACC0HW35_9ERIC|nr:hypothetical protein LOK49_LG04G01277 [Camellia lanceoleosa]
MSRVPSVVNKHPNTTLFLFVTVDRWTENLAGNLHKFENSSNPRPPILSLSLSLSPPRFSLSTFFTCSLSLCHFLGFLGTRCCYGACTSHCFLGALLISGPNSGCFFKLFGWELNIC